MLCTGLLQELFYSFLVVFESRTIGKFVHKLMVIGRSVGHFVSIGEQRVIIIRNDCKEL